MWALAEDGAEVGHLTFDCSPADLGLRDLHRPAGAGLRRTKRLAHHFVNLRTDRCGPGLLSPDEGLGVVIEGEVPQLAAGHQLCVQLFTETGCSQTTRDESARIS